MTPEAQNRPLHKIAQEIEMDWGSRIYFGAKPYVQAMSALDRITDYYRLERGDGIVRYFLANAATWRGATARRIKIELKAMIA